MEHISMTKAEWGKQRYVTTSHAVENLEFMNIYADLDQGEWYRISEFMAKKGASLKHQYQKLLEADKKGLTKEINAVREVCVKIRWANTKAAQHDVNTAFDSMVWEVSRCLSMAKFDKILE